MNNVEPVRFKVVVPVWKSPWVGKCLESLKSQDYKDFRCVVIDDTSGDDTIAKARAATAGDPRFEVRSNGTREGALSNVVKGFRHLECQRDDVLFVLDGDDWLAHGSVLSLLEGVYRSGEVQLTYGQFEVFSDGRMGQALPFPNEVKAAHSYREYVGDVGFGQLRTFRYGLWNLIREDDLKDPETGKHWRLAWDVAMMLPMLEMCEPDEVVCVEEPIYVYNDMNPLSDFRMASQEQLAFERRIRAKKSYVGKRRRKR